MMSGKWRRDKNEATWLIWKSVILIFRERDLRGGVQNGIHIQEYQMLEWVTSSPYIHPGTCDSPSWLPYIISKSPSLTISRLTSRSRLAIFVYELLQNPWKERHQSSSVHSRFSSESCWSLVIHLLALLWLHWEENALSKVHFSCPSMCKSTCSPHTG